jgi:hypothetical protein
MHGGDKRPVILGSTEDGIIHGPIRNCAGQSQAGRTILGSV